MRRLLRAVLVLPLVLPACATPVTQNTGPNDRPSETLYTVSATVLEDSSHGASLCAIIGLSHPPSCGNVPITNWDWAAVNGERRAGKTIWGIYTVFGTYDGAAFTLAQPPVATSETTSMSEPADFHTPCDEPESGWTSPDPSRTKDEDRAAALENANDASDFAGAWVDDEILNVAFTGEIAEHEATLRRYWGGPLCVVRHAHTISELKRITDELMHDADELFDLQTFAGGPDDVANAVRVGVVLATEEDQRRVERHYGEGLVVVDSWLRPV